MNLNLTDMFESVQRIKNKLFPVYSNLIKCNDGIYIDLPKVSSSSIKKAIIGGSNKRLKDIYIKTNKVDSTILNKPAFTFVRNPYARVLSAYIDKVKYYNGDEFRFQKEIEFLVKTKKHISFKDFVRVICLVDDELIEPHFRSMSFMINQYAMKNVFIGKLETLERDWKVVQKKFGVGPITRLNKSKEKYTLKDYYDKETQNLVYQRYFNDFLMFGYDKKLPKEKYKDG